MRLREEGRSRNGNGKYRICVEGLVTEGTEKRAVGGEGNCSFQVVPPETKAMKLTGGYTKDFKEGRGGDGKSGVK